jgi:hypothetical protein
MRHRLAVGSALLCAFALPGQAYDVTDSLSIGAVLGAAGQCQEGVGGWGDEDGQALAENTCRGGMPFQLQASFRPSERDEFFALLGYAVDNSLNDASPFVLAPWAADLEDDVQDINGRGRDYLLQAWYKHTLPAACSSAAACGAARPIPSGLAYGYLDGADTGIANTNVAELYYRFAANDFLALTADIQYMADDYDTGEDLDGWIFGVRLVAEL